LEIPIFCQIPAVSSSLGIISSPAKTETHNRSFDKPILLLKTHKPINLLVFKIIPKDQFPAFQKGIVTIVTHLLDILGSETFL